MSACNPRMTLPAFLELAKIGTRGHFVRGCAVAYVALCIMARAHDTKRLKRLSKIPRHAAAIGL